MNQVIRSCFPVLIAIIAVFVEHRMPRYDEAAVLVAISMGVALAVTEGDPMHGANTIGVLLCTGSLVIQAVQISLMGRLLTQKFDSLQMAFYTGPSAFLVLLVPGLYQEGAVISQCLDEQFVASIAFVLGSCVMAICYNLTLIQSIKVFSSVGLGVLSNVKVVFVILLSAVCLGEVRWSAGQYFGCILTLAGSAAFTYIKQTGGMCGGKMPDMFGATTAGMQLTTTVQAPDEIETNVLLELENGEQK